MTTKTDQRILISSSAKSTIKDTARLAEELCMGLEISRLPFYGNKNITEEDVITKLKEDLKDFTGRKTLHAMFSDINIASNDYMLSDIGKLRYSQSYNVGKAIGADTILFHTGNKGTKHYGSQKQFKKKYIEFWRQFIKQFEADNIVAVVENVYEETPEYCMELCEGINSPNYKLALDVGHVNLYAQKTQVTDWIKAYGNKLYHMHIHNNFRENDDHSNLENGTLNYKDIFSCIRENNICPSYVFEMFTEEDIRKSLAYYKKIN
mgnify:CR=1 FL=1